MTKNIKTKILVFDQWKKGELFKEYLGKTQTLQVIQSYKPEEALELTLEHDPAIIVLGGDFDSNFKGASFCKLLIDNDLLKGRYSIITTWDAEEAEILRGLLPKVFYCPFCESLVNIVKTKAGHMRTNKLRKKK